VGNYQPSELERVGRVIRRALESAGGDPRFYRPRHRFRHAKQRKAVEGRQLAFRFPEPVRDFERPLVDLIPEAYRYGDDFRRD